MDAVWNDSISNNTSDAKLVSQRVFVGNIKPHITRENLFELFKKFGTITAISINRNGYGFVQFSSEEAAVNAQEVNGVVEKGCSLQVKSCSKNDNRKRPRRDRSRSPPPSVNDYSPARQRSQSPARKYQSRYPAPAEYSNQSSRGGGDDSQPDDRHKRSKGSIHDESRKPNDCEIVVMSKQLREYAEIVERRLKNLGLKVDVLFMKDEALLAQALDDLGLRGTLYACVIALQHQTHNSLTLNVLHGVPQEHRNMPVDDALKFIAKNFREHLEKQRDREVGEDEREIKFLLKLVIESRYLSMKEYDRLIDFLQMKRQKLMRDEFGDDRRSHSSIPPFVNQASIPRAADPPPISSMDLQDQIRKLIATPPQGLAAAAAPVVPAMMSGGQNPLAMMSEQKPFMNFNAPRIQEALGQLFKNGANDPSLMLNDPRMDSRHQPYQMQSQYQNVGYDPRYSNDNGSYQDQRSMRGPGYDSHY